MKPIITTDPHGAQTLTPTEPASDSVGSSLFTLAYTGEAQNEICVTGEELNSLCCQWFLWSNKQPAAVKIYRHVIAEITVDLFSDFEALHRMIDEEADILDRTANNTKAFECCKEAIQDCINKPQEDMNADEIRLIEFLKSVLLADANTSHIFAFCYE